MREWYKQERAKAKKGSGGTAVIDVKLFQRVVEAHSKPPKQPAAVDVYLTQFKVMTILSLGDRERHADTFTEELYA